MSPDYSWDGKRLVFESRRTGSQEIWVTDADGRDAVQITSFGGPPVGSPRWSPDGAKIAFDSRKPGVAAIYVVSANGGAATRITTDGANNHLPAWSADGRWLFFGSDRTGPYEIWKIAADGNGQAVQVTSDGGDARRCAPADTWLYWYKKNEIWRVPQLGGAKMYFFGFRDHKPVPLDPLPRPASPRANRRPTVAISPDQKRVLFTMTTLDRGDLMLIEGFR